MQINELKNDGLTREYKITIEKADLDQRVQNILNDLRHKVRMKGFRPGKTPVALLKKIHGEAALGQAVEESVRESTDQLFREKKIRPALQPKVDVGEVDEEKGFEFTLSTEILPDVDTSDFKAPALERLIATPSDADVDAAIETLAGQSKSFETAAKTYKAKTGDAVVIDFVGSVDGEEFEGGKGEDFQLELGSGQFIAGFEDQLVGAKTGDKVTVKVTFPDPYGSEELAGKDASFDVEVKEVKKPADTKIDDDMAKNFGLESLDQLKEALKTQLEQEAKTLSRAKVKRALLDKLADSYDFAVPQGMVDLEYRDIWQQIKRDAVMSGEATESELADKDEPESEEDRADYRNIAERRVRLGLLLSELGLANKVEINRDELMRRVADEARRYPGQEREVFEFYTKNEQAMAQLRAPLYEDKVVDFILEMADLKDTEISLKTCAKPCARTMRKKKTRPKTRKNPRPRKLQRKSLQQKKRPRRSQLKRKRLKRKPRPRKLRPRNLLPKRQHQKKRPARTTLRAEPFACHFC